MVNQRESTTRKKFITFMVLPHNSTREVFRLNLPRWLAVVLGTLLTILALSVLALFIYSSYIAGRLAHYVILQAENKIQSEQIKTFYNKTQELETGIRELEERDQELREILGLKKTQIKTPSNKNLAQSDLSQIVSQNLAALNQYVENKRDELAFIYEMTTAVASKFDYMPSEMPVPGAVYSKYGFRTHPVTGKRQLHAGIDIPIWEGCPIRATATGVVIHSGWAGGFGNCVIIDHQNGYRTIYAHNQRNLVGRGERIAKGQIIGNAGSTGISTGSHVHYQLEYRNSTVDPERFLNLNIRTASRIVK